MSTFKAKTIYLLRHGETEFNRHGIVQGSGVDSSLNELGKLQADAFFSTYGHLPFEAVFTSTLQRTHQTVKSFIEAGIHWQQYPEINEISWGVHEGKRHDNNGKREFRKLTDAWQRGHFHERIEGGESALELEARMKRFTQMLYERPESLLLVCSHGRAMRGLLCVMLGKSLRSMEDFSHHNTGLWRLHLTEDGASLDLKNDTQHLLGIQHPAEHEKV